MYSPLYRILPTPSPSRSTPSLDNDTIEYYSPPDDYLATPDLSEWKEIRRLEDERMRVEAESVEDAESQYELPSLDILSRNQKPLLSELPPQLPPWPHSTIAPKDAFPDYAEVHRFLQEQACPSSPSAYSSASSYSSYPQTPYHDYDQLPDDHQYPSPCAPYASLLPETQLTPLTSAASPDNVTSPVAPPRKVGKKAKREADDDYEPSPKRRMLAPQKDKGRALSRLEAEDESDEDEDNEAELHAGPADDDESGDFRPARRLPLARRKPQIASRGSARSTVSVRSRPSTSMPRRAAQSKSKSNRGEDYQEGPCDCRDEKCTSCQMTCFYTFVHGPRKGDVCKRLFESGRHLDLKRHKATHAVQEWKWLQDGEITSEMARWHFDVFEGKEHGLICPNGDCTTTFTRYDALKRHMERGTCQYMHLESDKDGLDNRQVKARVIHESDEKYGRMTQAKHT